LIAVLTKTSLLKLLLRKTLLIANADIIRITTKLMIALTFRQHDQRVFIGEPSSTQQPVTQNTETLFRKLDLSLHDEKQSIQSLLKKFLVQLSHFEQDTEQESYLLFIHLVSSVLLQTTSPTNCRDQRENLFPISTLAVEVIRLFISTPCLTL
jgi:hypothetical protein